MGATYIIDRFEGGFAVCEDMESLAIINLSRADIPAAKPGDVLVRKDGGFEIDRALTEARKTRIRSLFEELKR